MTLFLRIDIISTQKINCFLFRLKHISDTIGKNKFKKGQKQILKLKGKLIEIKSLTKFFFLKTSKEHLKL